MFTVHRKVIPDNTSVHLHLYPSHIKGAGPIWWQAQISTGFHDFTKSGQIFHNKINTVIVKRQNFTSWKLNMVWTVSKYPVWMTQKHWKWVFGELKSQKFPWGTCLQTPLEAWAFSALGNQSASIQDPRLGEPKYHSTRPAIGLRSSSAMTTTLINVFSIILIFTSLSSLYMLWFISFSLV